MGNINRLTGGGLLSADPIRGSVCTSPNRYQFLVYVIGASDDSNEFLAPSGISTPNILANGCLFADCITINVKSNASPVIA